MPVPSCLRPLRVFQEASTSDEESGYWLRTSVCIILAAWPAKHCLREDIQLSGRVALCVHWEPEECSVEEKFIIGGQLIAECVLCVSGCLFSSEEQASLWIKDRTEAAYCSIVPIKKISHTDVASKCAKSAFVTWIQKPLEDVLIIMTTDKNHHPA